MLTFKPFVMPTEEEIQEKTTTMARELFSELLELVMGDYKKAKFETAYRAVYNLCMQRKTALVERVVTFALRLLVWRHKKESYALILNMIRSVCLFYEHIIGQMKSHRKVEDIAAAAQAAQTRWAMEVMDRHLYRAVTEWYYRPGGPFVAKKKDEPRWKRARRS